VPEPGRSTTPRRPRRTQAERRETTRASLLTAAAELITEKGISSISLAEIGRRAGYSHAIVNQHFGSKAVLIEQVVATVEQQFTVRLAELGAAPDGLTAILRIAEAYVDLGTEARSFSRANVVVWTEAVVHADLRPDRARADRQTRNGLGNAIQRGIDDGTIRDDLDPTATAVAILGMLRGVLLQAAVDPKLATRRRLHQILRESVRAMLAAPGHPPLPT
jgi:AcrR family transcriptional regulator